MFCRVSAVRAPVRSPQVTRASRETSDRPNVLMALDLAQSCRSYAIRGVDSTDSRESYSKRTCCWGNVIDTVRCCHLPSYDARCWRADYEYATLICGDEAAAVIGNPASALL